MMKFVKSYGKFILFFVIVGLIGGYFVGIYSLEVYSEEMLSEALTEFEALGISGISMEVFLGIVTAIQSAGYGLFLGIFGIILAKKIGLWDDDHSISAPPLLFSLIAGAIGGAMLIFPDLLFFNKYSEALANQFSVKPSIPYVIATVTYGAVIEEVMARLFLMSLIAWVLAKIFEHSDLPSVKILVIANIISALAFAAGHLPMTLMTIGSSPIIIARCFLLNGLFGLLFGFLYRKYGLRYAMITHGMCHVVSKLIWLLFL